MFAYARLTAPRLLPLAMRLGQQCMLQRRSFSPRAIHRSFPCDLFYWSPGSKSDLYDSRIFRVFNGPCLQPNDFGFETYVREIHEQILEEPEKRLRREVGYMFTFRKGTQLPSDLTLINHDSAQFSLQPTRGMLPKEFNETLDLFYKHFAHMETCTRWIERQEDLGFYADKRESWPTEQL